MSEFKLICKLEEIPQLGSRVVKCKNGNDIAVFRTSDDEIFAVTDKCPHKGGALSQGIVYGKTVACPLHGWQIGLDTGKAAAPDEGCAHKHAVKVVGDEVYLEL